jgi:plastocyanin
VVGSTSWAGEIQGNAACGSRCSDYVVYVESVSGDYSGEGTVATFDQESKTFIPHVLAILKGTTVQIRNSDPFLHNVHIYRGKETYVNIALPFQGQTIDQLFDEGGNYVVLCDAHPEMSAFIVVLEHPFFAGPDDSGEFEISELAPGTYTLIRYDAEKEKSSQKQVVVSEGPVEVDF